MSQPVPDRDLRVSDDERTHIVGVLEKATGRGLITLAEFSTRSEQAMLAKTRGELNAVVFDLPGVINTAAPRDTEATTLRGSMTTVRRSGRWTVPAELDVRTNLSNVQLDFTHAICTSATVHIHLAVTLGSVRLVLPRDMTVDHSALTVNMGSQHGHGIGVDETPGERHLILTGEISMGTLKMHRRSNRWFC